MTGHGGDADRPAGQGGEKGGRGYDGLGLVLSGGGSRGIAQIGVLRALLERGIRPAAVAGTSAGAIVGALYGAGYSPAEMLDFFHVKSPFRLSKLTLAKPGIIDTDKVVADFEEYFPEDSFAALDVPLSVVATDILTGEAVVFDSGRLIPPVLASASVPMVFTPTRIDGRWLTDGGVVDNFPVEELSGRCRWILGVFASPLRQSDESQLRTSLAVLQRAFEVGTYAKSSQKFTACDFLICPQGLDRFGTFDTRNHAAIEAIGYAAAGEQLDAIERSLGG